MKITFAMFRPALSGGTRVTATYAELLAKRGHDVSLVFLGPARPPLRRRVSQWLGVSPRQVDEISPFILKAGVPYQRINDAQSLDARHFPDADVVIATFWRTAYWVASLPASKGAKAYFIQHGVFPDSDDDPLNASYRLPLQPITISKSLRCVLEERFGASNVPVIYNSVDTALFNAPPRERNKRFTVGFLYSPAPKKGLVDCKKAIEAAGIDGARFVAFGATAPTDEVPLPDGTEFALRPAQSSIKSIYSQCDVWLCASHAEGFHLPPLEAMACRTPVVSTKVGGPLDIVVDGRNGFLTEVGDIGALARRLREFAGMTPAAWRQLSDGAYETATNYSWEDAAIAFEAELNRIAAAARN